MKNDLYIFPGQGCQYVGIGSDIVKKYKSVSQLYELANDLLHFNVSELSFSGPEDQINLTKFTQPVLVTHQLACFYALCEELNTDLRPSITAGHSLGEYTALVIGGSLAPEQAIRLVAKRGALMSELGTGSMMATTLTLDDANRIAREVNCSIAGINLPEQIVLAGLDADLEKAINLIQREFPKKRAIPLKTEGAFHSYLMKDAAAKFLVELQNEEFKSPSIPVLSNYTGLPHENDRESIINNLYCQLFSPVRWVDCISYALNQGASRVVEFGGGIGKGIEPSEKKPNLQAMMKKLSQHFEVETLYFSAINTDSIEETAKDY